MYNSVPKHDNEMQRVTVRFGKITSYRNILNTIFQKA